MTTEAGLAHAHVCAEDAVHVYAAVCTAVRVAVGACAGVVAIEVVEESGGGVDHMHRVETEWVGGDHGPGAPRDNRDDRDNVHSRGEVMLQFAFAFALQESHPCSLLIC